jgi:ATP-dependent Zn protease
VEAVTTEKTGRNRKALRVGQPKQQNLMENQEAQQQPQQPQQPVTISDWFLTLFLTAIPLVGLIMLFVWAFGSNTNPSKAN